MQCATYAVACMLRKCLHETSPCDIEILGIFIQEFLLELVTRGNMHHIVDEQAVDDKHPIPPGQNEHAVGICQIAQLKKVKL